MILVIISGGEKPRTELLCTAYLAQVMVKRLWGYTLYTRQTVDLIIQVFCLLPLNYFQTNFNIQLKYLSK